MNEPEPQTNGNGGKPFKITEVSREIRKGVVATSLQDLTLKVVEKLPLDDAVTVVLEQDGTEIDDEDYFATLEPHTSLMVLTGDQKWSPPQPKLSMDTVDDAKGGPELAGITLALIKHITAPLGPTPKHTSIIKRCRLQVVF